MLIAAVIALTLSANKVDILECADLENDTVRLACFDAAVKAQMAETTPKKTTMLYGYEHAIDSYLASELKDPMSIT